MLWLWLALHFLGAGAGEGEVAEGGGGGVGQRLLPGHWVCGSVQRSLRAGPLSRGLVRVVVEAAVAHIIDSGAHSLFYCLNKPPIRSS